MSLTQMVAGFHGQGWKRTTDLENAIYGWLMEHADFREAE